MPLFRCGPRARRGLLGVMQDTYAPLEAQWQRIHLQQTGDLGWEDP